MNKRPHYGDLTEHLSGLKETGPYTVQNML